MEIESIIPVSATHFLADLENRTIKVFSSAINSKGQSLNDGDKPLYLFTAFTNDAVKGNMSTIDFFNRYQTLAPQGVTFTINGNEQVSLPYARFLEANPGRELLGNAMHITTLVRVNELINNALEDVGKNINNLERYLYFDNGAEYDFKSQDANGMSLTLVEGVGVLRTDAIGNFIYGNVSVRANEAVGRPLYDGDYLQSGLAISPLSLTKGGRMTVNHITNVDDVYDGYSMALGALANNQGATLISLTSSISFIKTVTVTPTSTINSRTAGVSVSNHIIYTINGRTVSDHAISGTASNRE